MAILRHIGSERWISLSPRTFVGRSPEGGLVTVDPESSEQHALLFYEPGADGAPGQWFVRDSSLNGTWANGVQIAKGEPFALAAEMFLTFGRKPPTAEEAAQGAPEALDTWEVLDLGPPGPAAVRARTGELLRAEHGMLAVPVPGGDQIVVPDGASWRVHFEDDAAPCADGELLGDGDDAWTLLLPELEVRVAQTERPAPGPAPVRLEFVTTQAEKRLVEAWVVFDGAKRAPLAVGRGARLLLALALARLEDAAASERLDEHGWREVGDVVARVGIGAHQLALYAFTARRQLGATGVEEPARLIEDRGQREERELRLWGCDVVVEHRA